MSRSDLEASSGYHHTSDDEVGGIQMKVIVYWIVFAVTLAVYGTMLAWSLPTVAASAEGLMPFDMRPGGYSFAEAEAFLAALSAEGELRFRIFLVVEESLSSPNCFRDVHFRRSIHTELA